MVWTLPAWRAAQRGTLARAITALALSDDERRIALAEAPVTAVAFAGDRVVAAEKGRVRVGAREAWPSITRVRIP